MENPESSRKWDLREAKVELFFIIVLSVSLGLLLESVMSAVEANKAGLAVFFTISFGLQVFLVSAFTRMIWGRIKQGLKSRRVISAGSKNFGDG